MARRNPLKYKPECIYLKLSDEKIFLSFREKGFMSGVYFRPEFIVWMEQTMPDAELTTRWRKVRSAGHGYRGGWKNQEVDIEVSFPNIGSRMVFELKWIR